MPETQEGDRNYRIFVQISPFFHIDNLYASCYTVPKANMSAAILEVMGCHGSNLSQRQGYSEHRRQHRFFLRVKGKSGRSLPRKNHRGVSCAENGWRIDRLFTKCYKKDKKITIQIAARVV